MREPHEEDLHHREEVLPEAHDQDPEDERAAHVEEVFDEEVVDEAQR